jgi:hypothetical protein
MISDYKFSENLNEKVSLKYKFGFAFNVMMLNSSSWEINDPKNGR